jgi:hypothetical protein
MPSTPGFAGTIVILLLPVSIAGFATAAIAQPPGLQGSYLGVSIDGERAPQGFQSFIRSSNQQLWILDEAIGQYRNSTATSNRPGSQKEAIGNQFQGRLDFADSPLSLRGSVFLSNNSTAVLPTLTYDLPIGKTTNIYAGAGYVFVQNPAQLTPLGNQNGVVLTTGIEAAVDKRIVIYGDARLPISAVSNTDNSGVRFQFGAGYRF